MRRNDDADLDHAQALEESGRLRKQISEIWDKDHERRAARFNGLLGEAQPEWPEAEAVRWQEARRSMLDRYGEKAVLAWIEGKSGAGIPPQPSEDADFSEHLSILRSAFYSLAKGREHESLVKANGKRIKGGKSKEDELDSALEKLFEECPAFPEKPVEISLELAAHPEYFLGGKVPWLGTGSSKYVHLQTKIREALKRRK